MQAQGVIFTRTNQVEVGPVQTDEPGPNDAVIRVTHSWISNGTEGSYLRGERIAGDTAYRPGDPIPFPIVPGYQKVGVVESVGDAIDDLQVGETVFAALGRVSGMFAPFAGHVSPTVCDRSQIWKLPPKPDPLAYAGLVLTQVGYNCGIRPDIDEGEAAVVIGDGLVGQWAAQTLAWRGASVILVGRHDDRLARFADGANRKPLNASSLDWVKKLQKMLPDRAGVIVDTAGSIEAVSQSATLLKRSGQIVSAGFYGTQDQLSLQPLRGGEISVHLVSGWRQDRMDETRDLIAQGHLQTLPLITHHFPVAQAPRAWELIRSKREPVLGVILDWT